MRVNLDDTTTCPLAQRCARCGQTTGLGVRTAISDMGGVLCSTLCRACDPPALHPVEVALRTLAHCTHLGIDTDQMSALLHQEREAQQ
ncbi:MAG: hypothetical protein JO281_10645 [Pseudonocardiales bacterium]|nr:hypothetical protein [Pseudonocardiales bacterium]